MLSIKTKCCFLLYENGISDPDDYAYDDNGNMISDTNKGITSITYNHLNLPVEIVFNGSNRTKITYLYDALGNKKKKQSGMFG